MTLLERDPVVELYVNLSLSVRVYVISSKSASRALIVAMNVFIGWFSAMETLNNT